MEDRLQELIAGHPALFRGEPPQVPSHLPAGWYRIVHELCADLEQMLGTRTEQFHWIQLKEKFGTLRAYWALGESKATELDLIVGAPQQGAAPPRLPDANLEVAATPVGWRMTRVPVGDLQRSIHDRVREAEHRSETTCVVCGAAGELWSNGWLYTACDQHRKPKSVRVGPTDETGAGVGDV